MRMPGIRWNEARRHFYARFKVEGKPRYHVLGRTMEQAEGELKSLLAAHRGRAIIPKARPAGTVLTVADATREYEAHQRTARRATERHLANIIYHQRHLVEFSDGRGWTLGTVPVAQTTPEHLTAYLETARARGWTGGTLRHAAVHAKAAMRYCLRAGLIGRNPWEVVPTPPLAAAETPALTRAQVRQLLQRARGRDRLLLSVLYETAARPSEIARARWEDLRAGSLVLQEHKTRRRTQSARIIPLNSRARAAISQLPRTKSGLIFPSPGGRVLSAIAWHRIIARVRADWKGAPAMTAYVLRHSRITHLIEDGVDAATVARIAGNTPQMILTRYVHPTPEHVRQAIER